MNEIFPENDYLEIPNEQDSVTRIISEAIDHLRTIRDNPKNNIDFDSNLKILNQKILTCNLNCSEINVSMKNYFESLTELNENDNKLLYIMLSNFWIPSKNFDKFTFEKEDKFFYGTTTIEPSNYRALDKEIDKPSFAKSLKDIYYVHNFFHDEFIKESKKEENFSKFDITTKYYRFSPNEEKFCLLNSFGLLKFLETQNLTDYLKTNLEKNNLEIFNAFFNDLEKKYTERQISAKIDYLRSIRDLNEDFCLCGLAEIDELISKSKIKDFKKINSINQAMKNYFSDIATSNINKTDEKLIEKMGYDKDYFCRDKYYDMPFYDSDDDTKKSNVACLSPFNNFFARAFSQFGKLNSPFHSNLSDKEGFRSLDEYFGDTPSAKATKPSASPAAKTSKSRD